MNTEITIHPKLQHFGLATANLDAMLDWYRKVLGMAINARADAPAGPEGKPLFSAAFASNDEVHHRIAFCELSGLDADPDKRRHALVQHVAFEYETLDDLLGTYARLKAQALCRCWPPTKGRRLRSITQTLTRTASSSTSTTTATTGRRRST